jgi:hypothetical protein
LAAGLAALVLYYVQFSIYHRHAMNQEVVVLEDFNAMKTRNRMAEVFRVIGTSKDSDHKYIEVWKVFETAPREGEGKTQVDKGEIIEVVGGSLKYREKLTFKS